MQELEALEAEETSRTVSSGADTAATGSASGTRVADAREAGNSQEVVLHDTETPEGDFRRVIARVDAGGDLVLAGHDVGPRVQAAWGHADYEYLRTVLAQHVPRVLLELLKDRFSVQYQFHDWLESRGIASNFSSWP